MKISDSKSKYIDSTLRIMGYAALLFGVWLIFRYVSGVAWCVIAMVVISSAVDLGAQKLSSLIKVSKKLCASVLVFILLLSVGGGASLAVLRLAAELDGLIVWISEHRGDVIIAIENTVGFIEKLIELVNITGEDTGLSYYVDSIATTLVNKAVSLSVSAIGKPLAMTVNVAPKVIFGLPVFLISVIWLSVDHDRIYKEILSLFPERIAMHIGHMRLLVRKTAVKYLRVYVVLFIMTFVEVYTGLLVLKVPYAFIISIAVSLVDLLPILGSGAVLLPWASIAFFTGNTGMGAGLLILYGSVTVIRQVAEPYIVGQRLGVHPFISLAAMIVGILLFGVSGALLVPFCVSVIFDLRREGSEA